MENDITSSKEKSMLLAEKKETSHGIMIIVAVAVLLALGSIFLGFEDTQRVVEKAGIFGPIVLILLKAGTIIFAPISGSPLYPLAGAFFGVKLGVIYIFIGDLIGAVVSFWISRQFGQKVASKLLSKSNLKFLTGALEYMGTIKGLVIARILFSPLPEVVSYAAGLTKLKFTPFIIIHSFIGLFPTIFLVLFGAGLSVTQNPISIAIILLVGSVAAIIGGWIFIKYAQPRLAKEKQNIE